MTFVLYPYVYLLARAAFLEQSQCVLEVSRTLGHGAWRGFFGLALPLARPAIAAGLALAGMEALADYGTVKHFEVDTFTTGIYLTWFSLGSPVGAAKLAAILLAFVLMVLVAERLSRRQQRFHHTSQRYRPLAAYRLRGPRALAALAACLLPPTLGFAIPAGVLLYLALTQGDPLLGPAFLRLAANSFTLAALAGLCAVALAGLIAYGLRLVPSWIMRATATLGTLGYAVPGSVIAVGILLPFGWFDNALDGLMRARFGVSTGLLLSGTLVVLIFAYLVRFLAVSFYTVEAGLGRIRPSMDGAARTLGQGPLGTLARVHAPLLRGSLLTAGLLVFVDSLKELSATLILRPFNFDTLAIRVYQLASDERLAQSSTAALAILAVGIVPVTLLSVAIGRSRASRVEG
jgi:iron(III) transport system permease protein